MRARLVDADRELAESRPVLAQWDELLQKWENLHTNGNLHKPRSPTSRWSASFSLGGKISWDPEPVS